jgi:hypothetical protein
MSAYAVKIKNGKAELFDAKTGAYKRSVGSNAVSAQITGEFVQVTKADGKVEIYDASTGAYKRSI